MKVTEVIVSAGRTFNHPHEDYSNLKPQVTLKATLEDGEDPIEAARQLQAKAEGLVEDHKNNLLKSIEELFQLGQAKERMIGLQRQLRAAQGEMDQVRAKWPELAQLQLSSQEPPQPPAADFRTVDANDVKF